MTYENILTALADPTRRAILEDLRDGPKPVSRLADNRTVSRPAVSQHLKTLQSAGLVTAHPEGTARIYEIRRDGLAPLRAYLDEFWGGVLDAYALEVRRQMEKTNEPEDNDPAGDQKN